MAIIKNEEFNYSFDSDACGKCGGKCCTGESGYVWIDKDEIRAFAAFLKIKTEEFLERYTRKIGFEYSLKEVQNGSEFECIFFDSKNRGCKMYNLRPNQCCTFPFWEHFKTNFKELEDECIGILPLQ